MKMKKRILSCLLAVSMVAALAIPAFAEAETTTPIPEPPAQEEQTTPETETVTEETETEKPTETLAKAATVEVDTFEEFKTAVDSGETEITLTKDITATGPELESLKVTTGGFETTNAMIIPNNIIINGNKKAINFGLILSGGVIADLNELTINAGNTTKNISTNSVESNAVWAQGSNELTITKCNLTATATKGDSELTRIRGVAVSADSTKVTVTGSTIKSTADGDTDKFSYGIFASPTTAGGTGSEITGNTFVGCNMDIGINGDLDITANDNFVIGKHTKELKVYYVELDTDRQDDLDYLNFGKQNSVFRNSEHPLRTYFGARPSVILPTIANADETILERDIGRTWQYWDNAEKGPTMPEIIGDKNWSDIQSTEWNTGDANEYGTFAVTGNKVTLTAGSKEITNGPENPIFYAPYTTFGRGKDDTSLGNGFETSITFDMKGVAAGTSLYWEHALNETTEGQSAKDAFQVKLTQSSSQKTASATYRYNVEGEGYKDFPIEGTLDATKPITIKTTAVPYKGKVKVSVAVSNEGKAPLTASSSIAGLSSAYGGLRYGWVYFNEASQSVDVSAVTYRKLNANEVKYTVTYANGGGSETVPTQADLTEGATLNIAAALERSGFKFQHWTDGTNVYKPGSTVKMPKGDLTLTAVWLTDTITKVDDVTISEGSNVAITGSANQNIVATIKDSPLTEGTTSTIKLPSAGTVTKIVVPMEALAKAATSPITLTVADNSNKVQATWKFTAAPTKNVDLMVNPKVKTMLNATGLDTASAGLLENAVDVINFSHDGALPTATEITVPTGLGNGEVYVYKLDGTNKPMLSSIIKGTVDASKLTFSPPSCSNWAAFAAPLAAPAAVQPPPNNTPSHNYSGGGSGSSDKTAELSANSPAGTEAIVDSSVTNIANPVLDVKATAANAPEVAEFIKATTGFAVANVFQINMFDSTTVVKQVEGGKVEITLPFTAPDTSKQYVVLRYNDDKTITVIPATVADGKISFKTDHFSTYAIAVRSDNPNLFVNTVVNQPTIPSSPTTVPATGVALLDRLF